MTPLLPPSWALSHQLASQVPRLGASQRTCANFLSRVIYSSNARSLSFLLQSDVHALTHKHLQSRSYATKPGKPKAHTGRVTASKRKPAAATSDAAAGTPKKASARKSASTKKPAAKKRGAAEKPKRKTTSKAKAKGRPKRKVLTEKQKTTKQKDAVRQKTKNLKQQALLDPPKRLPATAYTVLSVETSHKGMKIKEHSKAVSEQYKSLSAEEMERLNHIANENKAKNEATYKKWLSQHAPAEIRAANNARNQLKALAKKDGKTKAYRHIQDERLVKQARTAYIFFTQDRFASGDMRNMRIAEVGPLIAREWKALSPAEKKPYEDRAARDKARYIEEYTTVYGTAPSVARSKKTT